MYLIILFIVIVLIIIIAMYKDPAFERSDLLTCFGIIVFTSVPFWLVTSHQLEYNSIETNNVEYELVEVDGKYYHPSDEGIKVYYKVDNEVDTRIVKSFREDIPKNTLVRTEQVYEGNWSLISNGRYIFYINITEPPKENIDEHLGE